MFRLNSSSDMLVDSQREGNELHGNRSILFSCPALKLFLPGSFTSVYVSEKCLPNLLQDFAVLMVLAETLVHSTLGRLL